MTELFGEPTVRTLQSDGNGGRSLSRRRRFYTTVCRACQAAVLCAVVLGSTSSNAITIEFNYDLDVTGFFGTEEQPTDARATLQFVSRAFSPLTDNLSAIVPGGTDSWSAIPDSQTELLGCVCNIAVPADTLVIYVGADDLTEGRISQGGPGTVSVDNPATASQAFRDAVANRGQGSFVKDFAPWGGFLAFDTMMPNGDERIWHFDVDSPPEFPAYDFASAAMHEIAHILGFGIAASFRNKATEGEFAGQTAAELNYGPIPLTQDLHHWATGVTSPPYLMDPPPVALGPSLSAGVRKLFTPLDYAALADLGWQTPEELLGLPGDADHDGDVDGGDFLMWQRGYGLPGGTGDVNGDQQVDNYDRWLIDRNFGAAAALPPASMQTPEPTALALALCAVGTLATAHCADRLRSRLAKSAG